jgi:hypothetical protein
MKLDLDELRRLALSVAGSGVERRFLCAKLAGERRTPPLTKILDVGGLPLPVQRRLVKRTWDCLRVRILRLKNIPPGGRLEAPCQSGAWCPEQPDEFSEFQR